MVKVYIDGQEGTTGLKILERFKNRSDIELLRIDEDKRKDADERRKLIHSADFTFLCLPDAAAREAVALADGSNTRIIDASTAHRTNPDWAYGFPELGADFREKIAKSPRTAVPGCYASGFISMAYPLVKLGIMPADYPVSVHAVSGYSGAGQESHRSLRERRPPRRFRQPPSVCADSAAQAPSGDAEDLRSGICSGVQSAGVRLFQRHGGFPAAAHEAPR